MPMHYHAAMLVTLRDTSTAGAATEFFRHVEDQHRDKVPPTDRFAAFATLGGDVHGVVVVESDSDVVLAILDEVSHDPRVRATQCLMGLHAHGGHSEEPHAHGEASLLTTAARRTVEFGDQLAEKAREAVARASPGRSSKR